GLQPWVLLPSRLQTAEATRSSSSRRWPGSHRLNEYVRERIVPSPRRCQESASRRPAVAAALRGARSGWLQVLLHVLDRRRFPPIGQLQSRRVDRTIAVDNLRQVLLVVVLGEVEGRRRRADDLRRDLPVATH